MIRETDIDKLKAAYPTRRQLTVRNVGLDLLQSVDGLIDDLIEIRDSVDVNQELDLNVWSSYDSEEIDCEVSIRGSESLDAYNNRISDIRETNIRLNKLELARYLVLRKEYGDGSFIKNFE